MAVSYERGTPVTPKARAGAHTYTLTHSTHTHTHTHSHTHKLTHPHTHTLTHSHTHTPTHSHTHTLTHSTRLGSASRGAWQRTGSSATSCRSRTATTVSKPETRNPNTENPIAVADYSSKPLWRSLICTMVSKPCTLNLSLGMINRSTLTMNE